MVAVSGKTAAITMAMAIAIAMPDCKVMIRSQQYGMDTLQHQVSASYQSHSKGQNLCCGKGQG